jgi:hypothetical protein
MKSVKRSTGALVAVSALALGLAVVTPSPVAAAPAAKGERLPLHVEDAEARPGSRLAVVIRAYASRPIGQGQVSFTADPPAGAPTPQPAPPPPSQPLKPAGTLVFSGAGDATVEFEQTGENPPKFVLRFVSPSATVNLYDGPLAVAFFDLSPNVAPGTEFELRLDAAGTQVLDADGVAIEVLPLDGKLSVRETADPYEVALSGGRVTRGGTAHLAVQTFEPVPWQSGRIGVRYDPAVLGAQPQVRMDPRHGAASFTFSVPTPGLLVLDFSSPGDQLNTVPGRLVRLELLADRTARPNTTSAVWLDPALTYVVGTDGTLLPLALTDGEVEIVPPGGGIQPTFPQQPFK